MGNSQIQFEQHGAVAIIRLDRPEVLNAFTAEMGQAWTEAYRHCDRDDSIRAVVVTGNGRAFCAGADMSGGGDTFDSQDAVNFSTCPVLPAWEVRKPVIAAMNGHAIGLGFSLALQCDFRIAAREGQYGLLQVRRGVLPDACTHWLLPRLAGSATATEMLLLGRKLSGEELLVRGLATDVVDGDRVLDTALALAEELASECAPLIVAMSKRLIWESGDISLSDMEEKESRWLHYSMGRADATEGGLAYAEKRRPNWQGRVSEEWPED